MTSSLLAVLTFVCTSLFRFIPALTEDAPVESFGDDFLANGLSQDGWYLMFIEADGMAFHASQNFEAAPVSRNGSNYLNSGYQVAFYYVSNESNATLETGRHAKLPLNTMNIASTCAITMVSKHKNCNESDRNCYIAQTNEHCMDPLIEESFYQNISMYYSLVWAYDPTVYMYYYDAPEVGLVQHFIRHPNIGDFLYFDLFNTSMAKEAYFTSTTIGYFGDYEWIAMKDMHKFPHVSKIGPKTGWTDGIFLGSLYGLRRSGLLMVPPELESIYNELNYSGIICSNNNEMMSDDGDCGSLIFNKDEKLIYGHVGGSVTVIGYVNQQSTYLTCMFFTPIEKTIKLFQVFDIEFNLSQRLITQSPTSNPLISMHMPTSSPSKPPTRLPTRVVNVVNSAKEEGVSDNELILYVSLIVFGSIVILGAIGACTCVYLIMRRKMSVNCGCLRTTPQYQQVAGNSVSTVPMVGVGGLSSGGNNSVTDSKDL